MNLVSNNLVLIPVKYDLKKVLMVRQWKCQLPFGNTLSIVWIIEHYFSCTR